MASAKMLPSGSWRVNLYVGKDASGKRKYKSFTGPDKKSVEAEAALYNLTRQEKPTCGLTLLEAVDKYISSNSHILAPSTVRGYNSIKKNYLSTLRDQKLSAITQADLQSWVNALAVDHSPKTVRNIYTLVSSVLSTFLPDQSFPVKLPKKQKKLLSIPNDQEVDALLDYFRDDPETQTALTLAAVVGMRRGEICALEFDDVRDGKIFITKALSLNDDYDYVVKPPKTLDSFRAVIIPAALEKKILSLKKADRTDQRIFHFTPNALTDRFIAARNKLGFAWRLHDLRHYNASVMLSLGIPDKYAMQRMGHATTNMLKTVYQHTFTQREIEVANLVNANLEKLIK